MKFNFKKIAAVLATTVMLGSTVAFAAAAWPEPFVKSGAVNGAIVLGSGVGANDMAAATEISTVLDAKVTATGSSTISGEGDKFLIGSTTSEKINLGDGISTALGTSITADNLPSLLAGGTFNNKQNSEGKYTQKINLANLTFQHFKDSELNDNQPTIGFKISSALVANYSLTFDTTVDSAVGTSYDLTDFETKNINILGKNYYILDFKNSSNGKITLLDSASSSVISEGETKTVTMNDKSYEVSIAFISDGEVILTINGVNTEKMSATGTTYGNTYKLADGTYVGIKTLNVQNYAGGTKNVEFSLGKGKLEITGGGSAVKLNDKSIEEITGYITLSAGTDTAKRNWDKLILEWRTDGKAFIVPGKELTMPGFEAIKLSMAEPTIPKTEITTVEADGDEVAQIKTTIKDGAVIIPILTFDTTTGNITSIGKSTSILLATSNTTSLQLNCTDSSSRFVLSWANSRDSESYYLKAGVSYDSSNGKNYVTVTNTVTGSECKKESNATTEQCVFGNAVLTIADSRYISGGEKSVNFTGNSGSTFNKIYTKEGLFIVLPWAPLNATAWAGKGLVNVSTNGATGITQNDASWLLWFGQEDKNGDLATIATTAGRAFNMTISTSGTTTKRVTVSNVDAACKVAGTACTANLETSSGSKIWQSYVQNTELASKILWDKTNSDQYSAEVENHGGEVYANVYVTAPSVSATSGSKFVAIKDTETATITSKDLIVVGGSCINSVAAKMLGSATPLCGDAWTAATSAGAGKYLIKVAANPYAADKVAVLVAGYEAADTLNAAKKLASDGVDATVVGTTVYPVATA